MGNKKTSEFENAREHWSSQSATLLSRYSPVITHNSLQVMLMTIGLLSRLSICTDCNGFAHYLLLMCKCSLMMRGMK